MTLAALTQYSSTIPSTRTVDSIIRCLVWHENFVSRIGFGFCVTLFWVSSFVSWWCYYALIAVIDMCGQMTRFSCNVVLVDRNFSGWRRFQSHNRHSHVVHSIYTRDANKWTNRFKSMSDMQQSWATLSHNFVARQSCLGVDFPSENNRHTKTWLLVTQTTTIINSALLIASTLSQRC